VVINGVIGRMGCRQHLLRSVLAIRAEGGVELADGNRVQPSTRRQREARPAEPCASTSARDRSPSALVALKICATSLVARDVARLLARMQRPEALTLSAWRATA
jgi:hypothetical protein